MELPLLETRDAAPPGPASVPASLRGLCGHVPLDERVPARGYRFFPMPGADLPSFLVRRLAVAGRPAAAVTLLGPLDPRTGEALLESCATPSAAIAAIGSLRGAVCLARLTVGPRNLSMHRFTTTFRQQEPYLFSMIASELIALAPLRRDDCELCRHENG